MSYQLRNGMLRKLFKVVLQKRQLSSILTFPSSRINFVPNRLTAERAGRRLLSTTCEMIDFGAFKTMGEMQQMSVATYSSRPCFGTRRGVGADAKYEWTTYKDFGDMVNRCRVVLHLHSIKKNDKVAIISNNRLEWAVLNYACISLGAQLIPMYEAQTEKDWKYIINDSESKLVVGATEVVYNKVKEYVGAIGKVQCCLCLDAPESSPHSFKRWMEAAKKEKPVSPIEVSTDHVASVIYTSGTTGNPKGVELSHHNLVSQLKDLQKVYKTSLCNKTSLAFLPWAHIYGQTTELNSLLASGSAQGIVSSRELILDSIPLIKPSMIVSVPVLFNRVYDGVLKKVKEGSPLAQKIFHYALKVSRERNSLLEFGKPVPFFLSLQHNLLDKIVFSKIRERLGGRLEFMTAGGAATSLTVLQFFEDIGIPICEGYGLTETSPVICTGSPGWERRRLGTVGKPLPGNDLRIFDASTLEQLPEGKDGEICVAGDCVMIGYRNNQKANDEVFFFKDGKKFFRTGDMGRLIDGGFLKITGRIKEQYKLENGKYVVPAPLEDGITRSTYVAQSFLYGDNKQYNISIIVPDFIELTAWAKANKIDYADNNMLMRNEKVISLMTEDIGRVSSGMKSFERPQKWMYSLDAFSQENQMLTPKMSLRRNNVITAYQSLIKDMYDSKAGFPIVYKSKGSDN